MNLKMHKRDFERFINNASVNNDADVVANAGYLRGGEAPDADALDVTYTKLLNFIQENNPFVQLTAEKGEETYGIKSYTELHTCAKIRPSLNNIKVVIGD